MTQPEADRWSAIRALFEEIVELPRAARDAALAAQGDLSPALRRAVEELLAADERTPLLEARRIVPRGASGGGAEAD